MLNLTHATNHRGHEGMMQQMRGRIFWEAMNKEVKELITLVLLTMLKQLESKSFPIHQSTPTFTFNKITYSRMSRKNRRIINRIM